MEMKLSNIEKRELRKRSYLLKPSVMVGYRGISGAVLAELNVAFEAHELVKVRFRVKNKTERKEYVSLLAIETKSAIVHQIGSVAVFFRKSQAMSQEI